MPSSRAQIEPALLQLIIDALQDRPVSPGGGRRATGGQEEKSESVEARVSMALQALAGFEWKGSMEVMSEPTLCFSSLPHNALGPAAVVPSADNPLPPSLSLSSLLHRISSTYRSSPV